MGMNPNKMHSIPFKKYISKKKGTNNDKDKINDEKDKQQIDEKKEKSNKRTFIKNLNQKSKKFKNKKIKF